MNQNSPQNASPDPRPPRVVAITGAFGNLGAKLIDHLSRRDWCAEIRAIDRPSMPVPAGLSAKVVPVPAEISDPGDAAFGAALKGAEAIVHFAAKNPAPDAPWDDAVASFDMSLHVALRAMQAGVRRLVFASSNHTMGRYKDSPLAETIAPGGLHPGLVPGPGTRYMDQGRMVDVPAYGAGKVMGERAFAVAAALSGGASTAVSIRIGWVQPGENHPRTMNPSGTVGGNAPPEQARDLAWFRGMWLSNRDFCHLFERALLADAAGWPGPAVTVNGMSANAGMAWSLDETRAFLGYAPVDDVWRALAQG